jgi:hypothetical protein
MVYTVAMRCVLCRCDLKVAERKIAGRDVPENMPSDGALKPSPIRAVR